MIKDLRSYKQISSYISRKKQSQVYITLEHLTNVICVAFSAAGRSECTQLLKWSNVEKNVQRIRGLAKCLHGEIFRGCSNVGILVMFLKRNGLYYAESNMHAMCSHRTNISKTKHSQHNQLSPFAIILKQLYQSL